ncbi:MAG: TlpA family protein disulfide reductase [Thermoleophilaceae bacterium]|nr:TlpA family protein disulfide reductase [Thermoleophilaceae bacterium]
MRRLLIPPVLVTSLGVMALLALLLFGLRAASPDRGIDEALAAGQRPPAPPLTLPRLDGSGTTSLADLEGDVVVLNYWASWCEPCREESPALQAFHERIEGRGGLVLGVDALDVTADAEAFIEEFGLTYPMLRDVEAETAGRFGVAGYPETIVIDRRGRIVAIQRGPVDSRWLELTVLPLLEEPA